MNEASAQIQVVLADDHPIVRKGLHSSMSADPRVHVVGEAADGEEALRLIQELNPDLAILDINMPKLDGLAVASRLSTLSLKTKIIFLSFHSGEHVFRAALNRGARGYLLKGSATEEVLDAIRTVLAGEVYMSPAIAVQMVKMRDTTDSSDGRRPVDGLTSSEKRILFLIAEGMSSKEIGEMLSIHYRTVDNHRTNICRKLGLDGSNALLRFAAQNKINLLL
jgi:DNA-binding NarL/FixJ family response regulator